MTKRNDSNEEVEHIRSEPRPDYSAPLPRQKLPGALQDKLDNEEKFWDTLTSGRADDSTESSVRYAAYAARFRTILLSAHRYVAYTSDVGESFRPIAHPNMVRFAYGISWAYLIGDVSNEGYKAYKRNQETLHPAISSDPAVNASQALVPRHVVPIEHWGAVVAQRAVFQSIASMGLPAFTIHSVVRYSGRALKDAKNKTIRTWGPIGLGLAVVPALPYLFDKPVEIATEWVFEKGFELVGGPEAVGHKVTSVTEAVKEKVKEKEL